MYSTSTTVYIRILYNLLKELIAFGACNIFGSFFECFVSAASVTRSTVQNNAKGKTQVLSIIELFKNTPYTMSYSMII